MGEVMLITVGSLFWLWFIFNITSEVAGNITATIICASLVLALVPVKVMLMIAGVAAFFGFFTWVTAK